MDRIQNLILKLSNQNHEVRKRAAMELGKIKSIRAIPALIKQIYKEYFFFKTREYDFDVTKYYFDAIRQIGPQSTHYIIMELIDSPDKLYKEFLEIIHSFKEESYLMLKNLFVDEKETYIQKDILIVWIILKESKAIEDVRPFLHSESPELVRSATLYFLQFGEEGIKIIKEELDYLLNNFDSNVFIDEDERNLYLDIKNKLEE